MNNKINTAWLRIQFWLTFGILISLLFVDCKISDAYEKINAKTFMIWTMITTGAVLTAILSINFCMMMGWL